jgi:hypothetical protein
MSYLRVSYTDNDQFSDLVKKKRNTYHLKIMFLSLGRYNCFNIQHFLEIFKAKMKVQRHHLISIDMSTMWSPQGKPPIISTIYLRN